MSDIDRSEYSFKPGQSEDDLAALYDGLDAAAQDSESWKAGYNTYVGTLEETSSPEEAYWAALDASTQTAEAWRNGWAVISSKLGEQGLNMVVNDDDSGDVTLDPSEALYEHEPMIFTSASLEEKSAYRRRPDDVSQDYIIRDDDQRLYGVYDGMGGHGGNPAAASRTAADAVKDYLSDIEPRSIKELIAMLEKSYSKAREYVRAYGEGGGTVATTVKIVEIDGKTYAGIAHTGDTRLFQYTKSLDRYRPLTDDQSKGNVVFNFFPNVPVDHPDQYMVLELHKGDRLMLCSDGITGDWPDEFLTNEEFLEAFRRTEPSSCAFDFFEYSKKTDDKSIIVVDVN